MLDLISRDSLVLHDCRFVVLDEADEMLDLGFLEDVEKILSLTPNGRQTALFSATMPPPIRQLADRYLYDPLMIEVESATLTIDTVEQFQLQVGRARQARASSSRCCAPSDPTRRSCSCARRSAATSCSARCATRGMNVRALHGDMTQGARDGVMLAFKGGRVPVLVATDVAARGLDISTVTHVINYDVPTSPDTYVHRIGRTGRVGRSGRAITFVEPRQKRELEAIERHIGTSIAPWEQGAVAAPDAGARAPAPALQAARLGAPRRRARREAGARAAVAPPASRSATSSARSPPRRRSTARRSATCSCSSASRSSRCRADAERVIRAVDGQSVRGHALTLERVGR